MTAQRVFSKAPWESKVGYCRAIRKGDLIFVTGTAAVDDQGKTFAPGDAYGQAKRCLFLIERALRELGARFVRGCADAHVRDRYFQVAGIRPSARGALSRFSAGHDDGRGQIADRSRDAHRNRGRRRRVALPPVRLPRGCRLTKGTATDPAMRKNKSPDRRGQSRLKETDRGNLSSSGPPSLSPQFIQALAANAWQCTNISFSRPTFAACRIAGRVSSVRHHATIRCAIRTHFAPSRRLGRCRTRSARVSRFLFELAV